MIQLPKRSVTRFFIPLVDVMTLLFCIFLLMPMVKPRDEDTAPESRADLEKKLKELEDQVALLQRKLAEIPADVQAELDKIRGTKLKELSQKILIRVLEVDRGKLYYRDPAPIEIHDQADARALIARDKRALGNSKQEMYYLLRVPGDPLKVALTTTEKQRFERWFSESEAAYGWDLATSGIVRGGEP